MTGNESQELRERLGGALDVIEPSPAPLSAVLRQGKSIRRRRRAGIAAGVAVAIGIGIAVPSLLPKHTAPQPVTPAKLKVTVHPGRSSVAGEIAYGTLNGRHWKVVLRANTFTVTGFGGLLSDTPGGIPFVNAADQAEFGEIDSSSSPPAAANFGPVRRDVGHLTITLGDGTVLRLDPVLISGRPYVAYVLPSSTIVTTVVAYGRDGSELGYAIPYSRDDITTIAKWLRPGQPVPPRRTARIGSGTLTGKPWSITGYAGPWGLCFAVVDPVDGNGADCLPSAPHGSRPVKLIEAGDRGSGAPSIVVGWAGPDVASYRLSLAGGRTQPVPVITLAGEKYFAFGFARAADITGWAAYDAAGHLLASGKGAPSLG